MTTPFWLSIRHLSVIHWHCSAVSNVTFWFLTTHSMILLKLRHKLLSTLDDFTFKIKKIWTLFPKWPYRYPHLHINKFLHFRLYYDQLEMIVLWCFYRKEKQIHNFKPKENHMNFHFPTYDVTMIETHFVYKTCNLPSVYIFILFFWKKKKQC